MGSEGLWSRTRQAAIAEITEVAMGLFLDKGFDATTFDDIAAAAGISRRSLFRYFPTKEDMVLGHLADEGPRARQVLAGRPADEPIWTALRNTVLIMQDDPRTFGSPELLLRISEMMHNTPSLRARSHEKHLNWQVDLIPEVKRRLGADPGDRTADLRAAAIITSAIACLDTAGEIWTREQGRLPLSDLLKVAFDAVRDADR